MTNIQDFNRYINNISEDLVRLYREGDWVQPRRFDFGARISTQEMQTFVDHIRENKGDIQGQTLVRKDDYFPNARFPKSSYVSKEKWLTRLDTFLKEKSFNSKLSSESRDLLQSTIAELKGLSGFFTHDYQYNRPLKKLKNSIQLQQYLEKAFPSLAVNLISTIRDRVDGNNDGWIEAEELEQFLDINNIQEENDVVRYLQEYHNKILASHKVYSDPAANNRLQRYAIPSISRIDLVDRDAMKKTDIVSTILTQGYTSWNASELNTLLDRAAPSTDKVRAKDLARIYPTLIASERTAVLGILESCFQKEEVKKIATFDNFTIEQIQRADGLNPVLKLIPNDGLLVTSGTEMLDGFEPVSDGAFAPADNTSGSSTNTTTGWSERYLLTQDKLTGTEVVEQVMIELYDQETPFMSWEKPNYVRGDRRATFSQFGPDSFYTLRFMEQVAAG